MVGIQAKAGLVPGSYDPGGAYVASPAGANELDLEQDLFGALRVLRRGQVSLLVPLVETWRQNPLGQSEAGGGLGDINANVRYDFIYAGASRWVPGLAALAGVTFPTGTPADAPGLGPLATGATGIGAYQINFGIAAEQTFGPWLVNATGLVADRTARSVGSGATAVHEQLGLQWTILAALAYTFDNDAALALSVSQVIEGDASINGEDAPRTGRRLATVTLSGVLPVGDAVRLQAAVFDNPPVPVLGANQTADVGLLFTAVRSWR
ncbi:MAG: hypothetical protein ACRENE_23820 [Polyangiaceae bacterium]